MIIQSYLNGLQQAYDRVTYPEENYWQGFKSRIHGASDTHIAKLRQKFPLIPPSLIELLNIVDGTNWQEYHGEQIAFYMFGSIPPDFGYPCYLNSCQQMMVSDDEVVFLKDYINRELDPDWGVKIDDRIIDDFNQVQ